MTKDHFPSFEQLFGELDFKQGKTGRSVYSPAAYLADLLQLLEDHFGKRPSEDGPETFFQRRADVEQITLNGEQAFSQLPYLDIVNRVMESKLNALSPHDAQDENPPYRQLRTAAYPLHLPFDLQNERYKQLLSFTKATATEIYKGFAPQAEDANLVAREYLGLSVAEVDFVLTDPTTDAKVDPVTFLRQHFNFAPGATLAQMQDRLSQLPEFLQLTGLSGRELRDLLLQNLSNTATKPTNKDQTELAEAATFFINHQTGGFAKIPTTQTDVTATVTEDTIDWGAPVQEATNLRNSAWFTRISRAVRLIRLAKKVRLSFADLDLILRSCCQNKLGWEALQTIAVIKSIADTYELAIDVTCSLASDISVLGIGDQPAPADLFHRIFNVNFVGFDKRFLNESTYLPAAYADPDQYQLLASSSGSTNLLSDSQQDYRKRIQAALQLSSRDLSFIVNKFRTHPSGAQGATTLLDEDQTVGLPALSLLFRISKLVELMDVSYQEFFDLLDVLDDDPSLRKFAQFTVLIHSGASARPIYQILQGGVSSEQNGSTALLWLVQLLLALAKWMRESDFTGADIRYMLTGKFRSKARLQLLERGDLSTDRLLQELRALDQREHTSMTSEQIQAADKVYQHFKPHFLRADLFVSNRFDLRAARVIHRTLLGDDRLVSARDQRIVYYDKDPAAAVAVLALAQLSDLTPADFLHLGVAEKMTEKIFKNLIIKGYIRPDGRLKEEQFPAQAADFSINYTSDDGKAALFELIHHIYQAEQRHGESEQVELAVYPSDLEGLPYSEMRKKELYDNLIFNGYIDEGGVVLNVGLFADRDNLPAFDPQAHLGGYSAKVYDTIAARKARFDREPLLLDKAIFADLPLKPIELEDLVRNLQFNGYLDARGAYADKAKILHTAPEDFLLVNPFNYRYAPAILRAMKAQIRAFKDQFFTVTPELLQPIADEIVAQLVYDQLKERHFKYGHISAEDRTFFMDDTNADRFELGTYFTDNYPQIVFKAIHRLITEAEKYRVNPEDFASLQLEEQEVEELLHLLMDEQYLLPNGTIPADKIDFFLNSNQIYAFDLFGFDDFKKDIFWIVQEVARETEAGIREITGKIKSLAQQQDHVLFAGLQEFLELPAATIRVICRHMLHDPRNLVEAIMIPLITVVNQDDFIDHLPADPTFHLTLRRILQFAALATKLKLGKEDVATVLHDQNLVEKFPENLNLPDELDRFDALLTGTDQYIYLFHGQQYWKYSADTYQLVTTTSYPQPLTHLSPKFSNIQQVDAAFVDPAGNTWLIAGTQYFSKPEGREHWKEEKRNWGRIASNFHDPEQIHAAFVDHEGKTYLFSGYQYVRYSKGYTQPDANGQQQPQLIDEGYPKQIHDNWRHELVFDLPTSYHGRIDAAFQSPNGKNYLFKEDQFICSDDFYAEIKLREKWGKVDNPFMGRGKIDAALNLEDGVLLFADNHLILYRDSLENEGVRAVEGSLGKLNQFFADINLQDGLLHKFKESISAAFAGMDGHVHLFSKQGYLRFSSAGREKAVSTDAVENRWGQVLNKIQSLGRVDAAFSGLDGRTYLFCDNQYVRYSRHDHSIIDEGYPRLIASDWGGLYSINSAFVLDGRTYLFGWTEAEAAAYVCYSTSDYSQPDQDFPKILEAEESFWNFTKADQLSTREKSRFASPDAVFIGQDDKTYLFQGKHFIMADHNHRWWSKPQPLQEMWDSLPFESIGSAFTGKNGITYVFEGQATPRPSQSISPGEGEEVPEVTLNAQFVSYVDKHYNKIDHRSPSKITDRWGILNNNIQRTRQVDAALTLESRPTQLDKNGQEIQLSPVHHTYLFSGNQFFRYTWNTHEVIKGEDGVLREHLDGRPPQQLSDADASALFKKDGRSFILRLSNHVDEGYPRYIATSLAKEPRFKHISADFSDGLDAAFADQRNVYLCKGSKIEVVADRRERTYPSLSETSIRCAFIADGSIYLERPAVEGSSNWVRRNAIEATKASTTNQLPPVLRSVPDDFRRGLDAVLLGSDQHAYLFKGKHCHNALLDLTYPLKEEWGRMRNNIQINNTIDAAFVGKDQNTYLFSGDQFVVYKAEVDHPTVLPEFIDGCPKSIKEHWFGLENVRLAFVLHEKTYLVEQWDQAGNFRYLCFSGDQYQMPDSKPSSNGYTETEANYEFGSAGAADLGKPPQPALQYANFRTWEVLNIPSVYYEEGFQTVHAVLQTEEHLFLLNEDHFIHFSYPNDIWTYARPMDRKWEDIALQLPDLKKFTPDLTHIKTAFAGPDGHIFFFSDEAFITYHPEKGSFSEVTEIRAFWGFADNNIQQDEKIDAAVVLDGKMTFLFSGDQYVRYSSSDYRYIDEGYPKKIVDDLRQEEGFHQLPKDFEDHLESLLAEGETLRALLANERNIYLFDRDHCHVFSRSLSKVYDTERIGQLKNNIATHNRLDAAYIDEQGHTLLFSGDQVFRYSTGDYDFTREVFVDEGYPKSIATHVRHNERLANLPNLFTYGIDAAFTGVDGQTYLFKDKSYYATGAQAVFPIKDAWGQLDNRFHTSPEQPNVEIDALIIDPNGKTFIFKDDQYVRLSQFDSEFADEGFPKLIKDNWGNLPVSFEQGIDGAFLFEGNTYLTKGDQYVRYSNPDYTQIDPIYPQLFRNRWRTWNDFLLGDLQTISRYAQLRDDYSGGDYSLTRFLYRGVGYNKAPYQMLGAIFDWDVAEVKWLKRRNVFLAQENQFEVHFQLEEVIRMYDLFQLAQRVGAAPSSLYQEVWQNRFEKAMTGSPASRAAAVRAAADAIYQYLGANNSAADWQILSKQLHNEMNLLKRDALMPYLIAKMEGIEDARALLNYLLIDVEMGNLAETSAIKEAISAVQLYLHRYFLSLESPDTSGITATRREELKRWWKWMKNYRIWEANRKVFLYPENYVRPELRDTKTPEFKKLEDALLQGELTRELAESSFKAYLDGFAAVGNLKITGANTYKDGGQDTLVLFGHTHTDPLQYYHRTAKFSNGVADWQPWQLVNIGINSTRVFPVHAFGRLMVFWIEIEESEESEAKLQLKQEENVVDVNTSKKKLVHLAHIKYAFYHYDKKWSPPQLLKNNIKLKYEIDAAYVEGGSTVIFAGRYCLKTSKDNPAGEVKTIGEYPEFANLPAEFKSGVEAATIFKGQRYLFKGGSCYRQNISNGSGQTLSFKNLFAPMATQRIMLVVKGPLGIAIAHEVDLSEIEGEETTINLYGQEINLKNPFPTSGFDSAFTLNEDILCLIDKRGNYFFYQLQDGKLAAIQDLQSVNQGFGNFSLFISTIANKSGNFAPADAIFKKKDEETGDNVLFVIRDGEFECYANKGLELIPYDGFPKPIKGNLSFNMDKFFNKLHVVWDGVDDGSIYLSYIHPKDQLLLSGKLGADFLFEEISIEEDSAKYSLLQWDQFSSANLHEFPESASDDTAKSAITALRSSIDALENRATKLKTIQESTATLSTVTGLVTEALDKGTNAVERTFQTTRLAATRNLHPLMTDSNPRIRRLATDLTGQASSLNQAFERLDNATREDRSQERESLRRTNAQTTELIRRTNTNIGTEVDDLKREASQLKTDFEQREAGAKLVRQNFNEHQNTSQQFAEFINANQANLKIWKQETNNADLDDNVPTLPAGQTQLTNYRNRNQEILTQLTTGLTTLSQAATDNTNIATLISRLDAASSSIRSARQSFDDRANAKAIIDSQRQGILQEMATIVNNIKERVLGKYDLFPNDFQINNKTNFTFSEPDWYIFEAARGTFLCRPLGTNENGPYEIIRLTTTMEPFLSTQLFIGGLPRLLSLETQQLDEKPGFGAGQEIQYNSARITSVPDANNLDFGGANGIYYQEIFFHAPFLIAQALNTAQQFEEAKVWYEFIFDPTRSAQPWQYLPFTRQLGQDQLLDQVLDANQMDRYLNDPFDPHAIAALRPSAYRKAIVMNYIDNLLDWGDLLFRQYTVESINEARMLYILAYDLLGDKPENLGVKLLTEDKNFTQLRDRTIHPDFELLELENRLAQGNSPELVIGATSEPAEEVSALPITPNDSILKPNLYFFIPENDLFLDYWERTEDRLYKIRQSLNILGERQPLPLFQPPIDPMALVRAVASGVGIGQLVSGMQVAVPPYRFNFMLTKARELVQKLNQFGGELLGTLEKKDAEALSLLQLNQEDDIFSIMQKIRTAQLAEAETNITSLRASLENAEDRIDHYDQLISDGMSALEIAQLSFMSAGAAAHVAASIGKIISAIVSTSTPDSLIGPFILGVKYGGTNVGQGLDTFSEVAQSLGEGFSMIGEALGVAAQYERMTEDWVLQLDMAESDRKQIEAQLAGAELQKMVAQYEIDVVEKEIAHNQEMRRFLQDKFTNQQLYQWMSGQLSGLFYQTYRLAYDMAKYAEKSYQFERAAPVETVSFIQPTYWNSQRKGLLAGEKLMLDLDRMEQAYIKSDDRRLEISKNVSLLEIDPLAFLQFKSQGVCEFSLTEALFDYDFPGHYCRQIKTIAVSFEVGEGKHLNAMLTQLSHKTVMEPDAKAVKFLLNPRDKQPLSIRSDWKVNQQVALSHFDEYEKNNGMFELRFDTDLYLPFEGTGAVSTWRLELKGKNGALAVRDLVNLMINVKYTAVPGGEPFADKVKGMLKPYQTVRYFDLNFDFHDAWLEFLNNDSETFTIPIHRELFPNMSTSKINGIFSKFDLIENGQVSMVLNEDETLTLKDGKFLDTPGLNVSRRGSEWTLRVKGNKALLKTAHLLVGYKASVQ